MSARAGLAPWNPEYRASPGNKRKLNDELNTLKADYEKRKLKSSLTGDEYTLPKQDYEELVQYYKEHSSELSQQYTTDGRQLKRNVQTPADFIDFMFEKKTQQKHLVSVTCQGGHILKLTYNAMYKSLMVEFTKRGDIVVFFNLPANVAALLLHHAENNDMAPPDKHGRERHAVGVEFWNLVRVRGHIHETRYPFQYVVDKRTGGAFGRKEGTGATGAGTNKWVYTEVPRTYKKWKKDENGKQVYKTDEKGNYIYETDKDDNYVLDYRKDKYGREYGRRRRIKVEDVRENGEPWMTTIRTRASSMQDKDSIFEAEADIDEEITEKDLADYFDNGGYDSDLGSSSISNYKKSKLLEAYNLYMSEDYDSPSDVWDIIQEAYGD